MSNSIPHTSTPHIDTIVKKAAKPQQKTRISRRAQIATRVLDGLGYGTRTIANETSCHRTTVRRYMGMDIDLADKELIESTIKQIRAEEINDLQILHAKARDNMHALLDAGTVLPIELIALMDRTFQQRRLLEGQSTSNIAVLGQILSDLSTKDIKDLKTEAAEIAKTQT